MKLQDTLLCVECEALYSASTRCPQCGSYVSYPLVRALNRPAAPVDLQGGSRSLFGGSNGMAGGDGTGHSLVLQRSA